jgi:hypothetical protein
VIATKTSLLASCSEVLWLQSSATIRGAIRLPGVYDLLVAKELHDPGALWRLEIMPIQKTEPR